MQNYEQLIVWQVSDELALKIYQITGSFPRTELYGLTSQLRRSAISIPTNIVEGVGRQSRNETRHFANIALGSLAETRYLMSFSRKLGYLNVESFESVSLLMNRLGSLLWNFYKSF